MVKGPTDRYLKEFNARTAQQLFEYDTRKWAERELGLNEERDNE